MLKDEFNAYCMAVSDRIGDYKRLLEDFNDRIVKRGRIDPGDAVILAINEKAIRDIADDGKQLYKSVSDLVLYATGAAECSTSDLLMVLEAVNTSLDDIERTAWRNFPPGTSCPPQSVSRSKLP